MLLTRRKAIIGAAALAAPAIISPPAVRAQRFLRRGGQQKPPGIPRIDQSHPLAQGLMIYCFDVGGSFIELVTNRPGPHGVGATQEPAIITPYGFVENCNVNETLDFGITASIQAVTAAGNWTCASAFWGISAPQGAPFCRTANNFASNPFLNWGFTTVNATTIEAAWNNGGATASFSWAGFAVNKFTSMALVAAGTTSALTYAQGALQNTTTGQTIQSANTNDHVLIGGVSNAALNATWNGGVFYGGFWSRPLFASEILQLHFDPYCFLIFPGE